MINAAKEPRLRYSKPFPDGAELLEASAKMGLEGIVSKRASAPYRSGIACGWLKVKTAAWKAETYKRFEHMRGR